MQAVGNVITYSFVMEDADDGCATGFGFAESVPPPRRCFSPYQRGGRLSEQQNRVVDDKAAGDVDALLFTTGEG